MMKRNGGGESQETKFEELKVLHQRLSSSVLEYMEQHRVEEPISLKTKFTCPELRILTGSVALRHDHYGREHEIDLYTEDAKLKPKSISVVDDNLEIELYLFKKSDTFDFEIEAILARNPKSQHNVMHWIIEEFIQTQKLSRARIPDYTACGYDSYTYVDTDDTVSSFGKIKSIKFESWDKDVKERLTIDSIFDKTPITQCGFDPYKEIAKNSCPNKGLTKFNLKPLRSVLVYKDGKINLNDIIFKGTDLYDKLVENVDKDTVYKLLISQDNQGNTPLHLLPEIIKDIKASDPTKSPHEEFFDHLLRYISSNLTDEMKVELLCIQNNDGNNILHLLKDNLEEHWDQVFNAFGNNAFIRATFQLNLDNKRALEIANHFPTELLSVLLESGGTTDVIDVFPTQEEESKNEEASSVIPVSCNNIYRALEIAKNFPTELFTVLWKSGGTTDVIDVSPTQEEESKNEETSSVIPVSDNNICSNPPSQQQKESNRVLDLIKQRLAREGKPISINTFMSWNLSEDDLRSELRDDSTIFGTIIAIQSLELIIYCIENILSSTQREEILFLYLPAIKQRLDQENTPILINTLTSLKLSEDHLLTKQNRSTIFGNIIAKQSLELIGYCIEKILSPWELYDYYQENSRQVNAKIEQNPNISLPEWIKLFNRKTIGIQLFCYLSGRKRSRLSLFASGLDKYEERKEAFFTLVIQIHNHNVELDEPNQDFCSGNTATYYKLHLCLYNLSQAMTADERKDTFCDCFSTYAAEFANCDPQLTIEILALLGLDPMDYLEKVAPNKSSCDPKLPGSIQHQTHPSAPPAVMDGDNTDYTAQATEVLAVATLFHEADQEEKTMEEDQTTKEGKEDGCTIS